MVAADGAVLILHFPIRRREQIKLKIVNGVEARNKVEELVGTSMASHWLELNDIIIAGDFDQWIDDLIAENKSMEQDPKKIVHDDRLRDYMLDLKREGRTTLPS